MLSEITSMDPSNLSTEAWNFLLDCNYKSTPSKRQYTLEQHAKHFKPIGEIFDGHHIKNSIHYLSQDIPLLQTDQCWYCEDGIYLFLFIWKTDQSLHLYTIPKKYERLVKYSDAYVNEYQATRNFVLNTGSRHNIIESSKSCPILFTDFELPLSARLTVDFRSYAICKGPYVIVQTFHGSGEFYGRVTELSYLDIKYKNFIVFLLWLINIVCKSQKIKFYIPKKVWLYKIIPLMIAYIP